MTKHNNNPRPNGAPPAVPAYAKAPSGTQGAARFPTEDVPLILAIAQTRSAVAAVMRIIPQTSRPTNQAAQFAVSIAGTAWCVADGIHFVTAHHVLNEGKARNPSDKFFLFLVPHNGNQAFHFPVADFPLEDATNDLAILTIDPGDNPAAKAASLPVALDDLKDGTQVVTCGFPSPQIVAANIDLTGTWMGGQVFLMSHANEGIVSAQYEINQRPTYELNVGWHHGESGGPICRVEEVAAFSVMQGYRTIQSPHGVVAGPHQGVSLRVIQKQLEQLGAHIV